MGSLLCLLESLVALAILCLILYVIYWAITSILGAFAVAIPSQIVVILKVIAILILVIVVVRALLTGEVCGYFGWSPRLR